MAKQGSGSREIYHAGQGRGGIVIAAASSANWENRGEEGAAQQQDGRELHGDELTGKRDL